MYHGILMEEKCSNRNKMYVWKGMKNIMIIVDMVIYAKYRWILDFH